MNCNTQNKQPRAAFSICSGDWGQITVSRQCFIEEFSFLGVALLCFAFFFCWMYDFIWTSSFFFLIIFLFPLTFFFLLLCTIIIVKRVVGRDSRSSSSFIFYDGWFIKGINAQRIAPDHDTGRMAVRWGLLFALCRMTSPPRVNLKVKERMWQRYRPQRSHRVSDAARTGGASRGEMDLNLDAEQHKTRKN